MHRSVEPRGPGRIRFLQDGLLPCFAAGNGTEGVHYATKPGLGRTTPGDVLGGPEPRTVLLFPPRTSRQAACVAPGMASVSFRRA